MNLKYMQKEIQTSLRSVVGPNKQARLIYLDVAGRIHSLYKELLLSPPSGYRFVTTESDWDRVSNIVSGTDILYSLQLNVLARLFPPNLIKAYLERFKRPPNGTVLTYSTGHLVFRKEPWVVDMEFVTQLTGYNIKHFRRFRRVIEKIFASGYCRKIICWTEAGKRTILYNLACESFVDKIEVVPLAVHKKNFVKDYTNRENVRLLFVGSANIPGEFEYKGGKEVLEAFFMLRKRYKNLELIMRSDIPSNLKAKYGGRLESVKLIEGIIPWEQLDREFKTADIFLFPAHSTPGLAILDAMSYELPVVTTDVWANTELVEDGKTGFVIKKSNGIPYYAENFIPNWSHYPTSKFTEMIKATDPLVVNELVEKISTLIESEGLRRSMGRAGRQEIEKGRFSIITRNKKLKKIFDDASEASGKIREAA